MKTAITILTLALLIPGTTLTVRGNGSADNSCAFQLSMEVLSAERVHQICLAAAPLFNVDADDLEEAYYDATCQISYQGTSQGYDHYRVAYNEGIEIIAVLHGD